MEQVTSHRAEKLSVPKASKNGRLSQQKPNCCDKLIKKFHKLYETCPPKHGESLWQTVRSITTGHCISFNAPELVRTAKIVSRGHIYGCQSAYWETSWIAFCYVVFGLHRGLNSAEHRHHQILPLLRVCFVQIQVNSMVEVTTSAILVLRILMMRMYMRVW